MTKLLELITKYMSILFDKYGFYIRESKNSGNEFSGASILLSSDEMEIFLSIERGEVTAYIRSLYDKKKDNWYSLDVVLALVGNSGSSGIIKEDNAFLFQKKLPDIIEKFSRSRFSETLNRLDTIENEIK